MFLSRDVMWVRRIFGIVDMSSCLKKLYFWKARIWTIISRTFKKKKESAVKISAIIFFDQKKHFFNYAQRGYSV